VFAMTTKIRLEKKELQFRRLLVGMNYVVLAFKEIANFPHKIKLCTLDVHSSFMGVEGTALRSRLGEFTPRHIHLERFLSVNFGKHRKMIDFLQLAVGAEFAHWFLFHHFISL
jgi:hypothetical protein